MMGRQGKFSGAEVGLEEDADVGAAVPVVAAVTIAPVAMTPMTVTPTASMYLHDIGGL